MLALLCAVSFQQSLQAKTVWATQQQNVWKVEAKYKGEWDHIGTGFIVKHGTRYYAVTAKHVSEAKAAEYENGRIVEKPFEGFRLVLDGKAINTVFKSMPNQDIAACRLASAGSAATVAFAKPEIGDKVYAIGYPANQNKVLSEGICNQYIKFSNSGQLIGFSAGIWYGNSGGALFNEKAEVVGVTVSKYRDPAPHLFYAEKCGDDFKNFLAALN